MAAVDGMLNPLGQIAKGRKMKRSQPIPIIIFVAAALSTPLAAFADYCAVGEIEGNLCKGFIVEACKLVRIDAVKGDDGKLFTVKRCYPSVSEYDQTKGRCWIRTKSTGGGLLSWAFNAPQQSVFYHKTAHGEYEELDVEYVTFKCVPR